MIVGKFTYTLTAVVTSEVLDVPCRPFTPEDSIAKEEAEDLYNVYLTEKWNDLRVKGAIEIHYVEIEPNPFF